MPYALRTEEDLTVAVRRVAGEQAHRGIDSLNEGLEHTDDIPSSEEEDPWDEAVHDARKRCKKIRAVARLVRDPLGDDYSVINKTFRDIARGLSDARDAWTLVETLDELAGLDDDDLLPEETVELLRGRLLQRYRTVRSRTVEEGRLAAAVDALSTAANDIAAWPLPQDLDADDVEPGLRRVYRRGYKWWGELRDTVEDDPHETTGDWHEWRKRAKYLWYHVRLLEPAWEDGLEPLEEDLDDLTDDLGDDHDLAVLVEVVQGESLLDPGATEQLAGAAAVQRHVLRREAALLADRLYVEPPKAFAKRLTSYVDLAHGQAA